MDNRLNDDWHFWPQEISEMVSSGYDAIEQDDAAYKRLRDKIAQRLQYLLQNNFDAAMQLLYRIDVPEKKAKAATAGKFADDAAVALAELIIERQVQKIISRRKYSTRMNNDVDEELRL